VTQGQPAILGLFATGPAFGVIPAVLIGGPLALLAMLFPSVFGGWKRWLTLLCVAGTNTTLYTLQFLFAPRLSQTMWGSANALWTAMTLITLAGLVLAFQRHYRRVMEGEAVFTPSILELIVLGIVSLLGVGIVGYARLNHQSLLSIEWKPVLPNCLSAWGTTLYVLYARLVPRRLPALATEVVMLTVMAFATTILMATEGMGARFGGGDIAANDIHNRLLWQFIAPGNGSIASTPVVWGDRVYVGVANDNVFNPYGTLYCLDRLTGKEIWHFDDGKKMRQIYSTPCVVEGKLYIGEGLHQDVNCKIYCLKADNGELRWQFNTRSHTESSPCVVDGKLFCGAGDDGLYCLEAETGKKLWNFPGYHIDTSPAVVGKMVFAGAGVGDIYKQPAILCLSAETGESKWLIKTTFPVWGSPAVVDDLVYFGLGNGSVSERDPNPAGELLCVNVKVGSAVWRFPTGDSVLGKPAIDAYHAYIGSSDNKVYCVNRRNGKICWHRDLGSAMIASPALVKCACSDATLRVNVVSSEGVVASLDANTGRVIWSHNLMPSLGAPVELVAPPVVEETTSADHCRRFYIGGTVVSTGRTAILLCYEETTDAPKD
jgi:outer membrane protein assembly factor BamB